MMMIHHVPFLINSTGALTHHQASHALSNGFGNTALSTLKRGLPKLHTPGLDLSTCDSGLIRPEADRLNVVSLL